MKKQSGFTIVELVIVITIMAILVAIAIPSFQQLMMTNRLASATNDLMGSLNLARSEAIRRGAWVNVGVTGASWKDGWRVFIDVDRNPGDMDYDGGPLNGGVDEELRIVQPVMPNMANFTVLGSAGVATLVSFRPDGTARDAAGGLQAGTVRVCYPMLVPENARNIRIAPGGRLTNDRVTVADCTVGP